MRPRIDANRHLSLVPEMRSRRDTGRDVEHARARARLRCRRGDDGGGEGEMNTGGSPLMRIHRRRIPFCEDISSLYSPLNQQLPAVLRGRSMLIDIALLSRLLFHPPYIPDHMNASTIAYTYGSRIYVYVCICSSPSLSHSLFLYTCACACTRRV